MSFSELDETPPPKHLLPYHHYAELPTAAYTNNRFIYTHLLFFFGVTPDWTASSKIIPDLLK